MSWFCTRSLQSQMVLKISPTASGVVVCWRIRRKDSWFSAGVVSSSQNRRYGSRSLPRRAASVKISAAVSGRREAYRYLVESIARFPDQTTFAAHVRAAGFADVRWRDLSFGIAAIHSGRRA